MKRIPLVSIAAGALALAASLHTSLMGWAEYSRDAIFAGEVWRLLSGHFAHWDVNHLFWDGVVFFVLSVFYEMSFGLAREKARGTLLLKMLGVSALGISTVVWLASSEVEIYRGLSGLCVTLFVVNALELYSHANSKHDTFLKRLSLLGLVMLLGKIAFEAISG